MQRLEIKDQQLLCPGHAACPGCMEALAVRHILNTVGPDTIAVVPPSCIAVICGAQPFNSMRIPVYQTTLESSAAAASGIRRALNMRWRRNTQVIVMAGDGGTYDIGLQCLSSAAERNEDMIYFCLDNEGYMNTGAQKSSSTPLFAATPSTPAGKTSRKKNLTEIMAAHEIPYAASATPGFLQDLVYKIEKARAMKGLRVITVLVPCVEGWGVPENYGVHTARLAVETGMFPLYEVEGGCKYTLNHNAKERPVSDYISLQSRYARLGDEEIRELQASVDAFWLQLQEKAARIGFQRGPPIT
ncbi:MAG: pyruvate synthase subunit beta [Gammaproteobacteria bacterium]|nr:pyruvate synthase subunit beta [Gammaproteobacteria bacterium]